MFSGGLVVVSKWRDRDCRQPELVVKQHGWVAEKKPCVFNRAGDL